MRALWNKSNSEGSIAWIFISDGPIFGTPAVDLASNNIFFATVKGTINAVDKRGKTGNTKYIVQHVLSNVHIETM